MSEDQLSGAWPSETLPRSWVWLPFDQFWLDFTDSQKKLPQKDYLPDGRFAVIDQGEALIGGFSNDERLLSPAPVPAIVFGDHTRAVKFIDVPFIQGADGVRVLSTPVGIDRAYAFKALRAVELPDKGYSRHFKFLKATSFPLPPLAEQKRIVAKLDALNAKSARARTELARIETLVCRYKQAVLSKAFSGELDRKELGELVVRIKAGKNLRCEERPPHSDEKGVVKVSAVTWGEFRPDQSKTLPSDFEPEEDTRIKSGDFLFSRANTIELVGAVVIVRDAPDNLYLSDKILRLEFREPVDKWLLWYLRSPMGREALMNVSSGNQLSMRNIGQKSLLSLSIPYADLELRDEIVRRIESAFAKIDRLAKEAKRALELVGRLDEAMLAKAFRGELVPQDENDEPAEHLLARIRAERQAAPKGERGRGRASTSEKTTQSRSASAMSKSRQDVEPNHLSRLLKSTGGKKPASELWLQSEMDIDEFYKQLRAEMDSGQIMEGQEKGELVLTNEN